jgi:hypothetical protein
LCVAAHRTPTIQKQASMQRCMSAGITPCSGRPRWTQRTHATRAARSTAKFCTFDALQNDSAGEERSLRSLLFVSWADQRKNRAKQIKKKTKFFNFNSHHIFE